jgi:lantibiotic modifying enzyme
MDLRERSFDIAAHVGLAILNPVTVGIQHDIVGEQQTYYGNRVFEPPSLFQGTTGTALLHTALFQVTKSPHFRAAAQHHLAYAAASLGDRNYPKGLLGGASGLLASASYVSRTLGGYSGIRARLSSLIFNYVSSLLEQLNELDAATMSYLDLFDGVSGMCIALALEDARGASQLIGSFGKWLAADSRRWLTPQKHDESLIYDVGLAHGIGGVLSALGRCLPTTDGQLAVEALIAWLQERLKVTDDLWPGKFDSEGKELEGGRRVAWCYGTLSTATSIWSAANRYSLAASKTWALEALERIAIVPRERWRVHDSGICHGTAGIALAADCVAKASGSSVLESLSHVLLLEVCDAFDVRERFGYRTMDSSGVQGDNVGLGEGSAGVALALLTCSNDIDYTWVTSLGLPPIQPD